MTAATRPWRHPEPIHSRVDLDEHFERALEPGMLEHRYLLVVVDDNRKAPRGDLRQLRGVEEAFEQQDASHIALGAQRDCRVELDQCEPIGFRECGKHAQQTVPVGIRLDDRQELRVRRERACAGDVAAKRGKAHLRIDRTSHLQAIRDVETDRESHPARRAGGRARF
jgi:hypothetical protein